MTMLTRLGAVLVVLFCAVALAFGGAPQVEALAACEVGGGNCCACNDGGDCITVQHQGVASCTFEFCSSTPCGIVE